MLQELAPQMGHFFRGGLQTQVFVSPNVGHLPPYPPYMSIAAAAKLLTTREAGMRGKAWVYFLLALAAVTNQLDAVLGGAARTAARLTPDLGPRSTALPFF